MLAAFAIVGYFAATWSSAQQLQTRQNEQSATGQNQNSSTPAINVTVVTPQQGTGQQQEERQRAERQETLNSRVTAANERIAFWTVWLAVVAGFQLITAGFAVYAARLQGRIMRDQLAMTHRPEIIVRNIQSPEASRLFEVGPLGSVDEMARALSADLGKVTEITGGFQIINRGSSPVKVVRFINATMFIGPSLPAKNPCIDRVVGGAGKVAAGNYADIDAQPVSVSASESIGIRRGQLYIFAIGKVLYEDESGAIRRTGFARQFNMQTGRFTIVTDEPDYEYVD
jgi:hypothetical protein